jgi:hypothetical protein
MSKELQLNLTRLVNFQHVVGGGTGGFVYLWDLPVADIPLQEWSVFDLMEGQHLTVIFVFKFNCVLHLAYYIYIYICHATNFHC